MATRPKIEVALCSDEDIPTCFDVMSRSFGHNAPFLDAYFPDHDTTAGRESGIPRLLAWKQHSEESVFLKAVTSSSQDGPEKIIGIAVWTLAKEAPSGELATLEDVERIWTNEDDREYMIRLWREYVIPRGEAITKAGDAGIWLLELLAVDTDYQRQGAGSALIKWGTSKAEQQGIEAIVEGTPAGRPAYEKCGFRVEIEQMRFDVGERFANRRKPPLVFMRKTVKS